MITNTHVFSNILFQQLIHNWFQWMHLFKKNTHLLYGLIILDLTAYFTTAVVTPTHMAVMLRWGRDVVCILPDSTIGEQSTLREAEEKPQVSSGQKTLEMLHSPTKRFVAKVIWRRPHRIRGGNWDSHLIQCSLGTRECSHTSRT